jgi:hypothetical protein
LHGFEKNPRPHSRKCRYRRRLRFGMHVAPPGMSARRRHFPRSSVVANNQRNQGGNNQRQGQGQGQNQQKQSQGRQGQQQGQQNRGGQQGRGQQR